MADQAPPRLVEGERATLLALLQYQRDSVVGKVEGITAEQARRSPLPTGTSLLWLVKHMAVAEQLWVARRFAGLMADLDDDSVQPDDTVESAVAAYRSTWSRVAGIVADSSLDDTCANLGEGHQVNLRWVLMHLLEETARHAGHADVLRELIDGETGR
jgi:hypothetical protein